MVHLDLIVLQNKSPELVVSLARKRKRDHFKPAENLNYSLCRQGNTKPFFFFFFCSYEVSFCDNCSKYHIFFLNFSTFSKFLKKF